MPYLKCKTENGYNWVFGTGKDWIKGLVETVLEGYPDKVKDHYKSYIELIYTFYEAMGYVMAGYYLYLPRSKKDAIAVPLGPHFNFLDRILYKLGFKEVAEKRIAKKLIERFVHETLHKCINDLAKEEVEEKYYGEEKIVEKLTSYSLK